MLKSQKKNREPMPVSVKVVAHRVSRPCVSDGYYKTCTTRAQNYALVVSGPILVREPDARIYPPTFKAYPKPTAANLTSTAVRGRGRGGAGGRGWVRASLGVSKQFGVALLALVSLPLLYY